MAAKRGPCSRVSDQPIFRVPLRIRSERLRFTGDPAKESRHQRNPTIDLNEVAGTIMLPVPLEPSYMHTILPTRKHHCKQCEVVPSH
jgi:hypothetical protein